MISRLPCAHVGKNNCRDGFFFIFIFIFFWGGGKLETWAYDQVLGRIFLSYTRSSIVRGIGIEMGDIGQPSTYSTTHIG